jgi:hypothetical protein
LNGKIAAILGNMDSSTVKVVSLEDGQSALISVYDEQSGLLKQASLKALFNCERVEYADNYFYAYKNGALSARYVLLGSNIFRILTDSVSDEPDRLGSWGSINNVPERGANWKQLVTNSPFTLGDYYIKGYWGPDGEQTPYYGFDFGSYPKLDGSTVAVPMAVEFARQHLGLSDDYANSFTSFSGTPNAYASLIHKDAGMTQVIRGYYSDIESALSDDSHPVDLVLATYPSDDELAEAKTKGVTLEIEPVCYDAFVFITHKDNPVDSLTLDQVRGIYAGKVDELERNRRPG